MSWFNRLFDRQPAEPGVVTARSVTFDTTGCKVTSRSEDRIEWRDLHGDTIVASLDRGGSEVWPSPGDPPALDDHYRTEVAARRGGIVSIDPTEVCGLPACLVVTKFEELPAYVYEGTLAIPLQDVRFNLTMRAREHGTTGIREAFVSMVLFGHGFLTPPTPTGKPGPIRIPGWCIDPYEAAFDDTALCSVSDDERLDALFADHPLAKVRRWLATLPETLRIAPDVVPALSHGPQVPGREPRSRRSGVMSSFAVGMFFMRVGRMDVAERHFAEAVPLLDGEPAADGVDCATALTFLGLTREMQGRFVEAEWAMSRALPMFRAAVGDTDARTAQAASNLGRVCLNLGRIADADRLFREAVPVFEAGALDSDLAVALNGLGLVHAARGEHRDAIPLFERALEHFERAEKASGSPIADCATVLRNLARSFDSLGDRARAEEARARAARRKKS